MIGFIKNNRTEEAKRLHERPIENHVLNVIAQRISRKGNPIKGVEKGEAIAGDYANFGLKRQPLRTAINNLQKWGYITTRATNRITYARLCNSSVYDCNIDESNHQSNQDPTSRATKIQPAEQPRANHYQEVKKKERKKKEVNKTLVEFREICSFFQEATGKKIQVHENDSKAMKSDKFSKISARLNEGATVEDCKTVIRLKVDEWKGDSKMERYLRIPTLFLKSKFEAYLDEAKRSNPNIEPKSTIHDTYQFTSQAQREAYFFARLATYRKKLSTQKYNTIYQERAFGKRDVEGLIHDLEAEFPELLKIKFIADSWLDTQ